MHKPIINFIYLKYFCDAVELNSVSSSAKENFVSQSAISQGINKLEKSLKKSLITHQAGLFRLTLEGQYIFEKAQIIFENLKILEQSIEQPSDAVKGLIEFMCEPSFAMTIMPSVLKEMHLQYPFIQCKMRLGFQEEIKSLAKKGIIDFGITLEKSTPFINSKVIDKDYYKICKAKLEKDIPNIFYVLKQEKQEQEKILDYLKKYSDYKDFQVVSLPCYEVIANFICNHLGIGLLPTYIYNAHLKQLTEIDQLQEEKIFSYQLKLIYNAKLNLNVLGEIFLKITSSVIKKLKVI